MTIIIFWEMIIIIVNTSVDFNIKFHRQPSRRQKVKYSERKTQPPFPVRCAKNISDALLLLATLIVSHMTLCLVM
jgi:hypothetical protein